MFDYSDRLPERFPSHARSTGRYQDPRHHQLHRRSLRVAAAGRPGGGRDQDRDPRQGGPVPHLGQGAQELQPELLRPEPQQEEPDPGHEGAGRPGGVPQAGPRRRRHRREPPPRRRGPPRHRLRRGAGAEPAHHLLLHLRLRAGRPVPGTARLRHHRPVPERTPERPHRRRTAPRPGSGLLRPLWAASSVATACSRRWPRGNALAWGRRWRRPCWSPPSASWG